MVLLLDLLIRIEKTLTKECIEKYFGYTSTDNDVEKQKDWIKAYKNREENGLEYYFIFEKPLGNRLGVSRIYNVAQSTFETVTLETIEYPYIIGTIKR